MKVLLDSIKNIFSRGDFIAKLICIILAVMLWVYVGSSKKGQLKYRIPIDFVNLQEGMILVGNYDKYVTLVFNGKQEELKNINAKNIKAYVNLENAVIEESARYPIKIVKYEVPDNIQVDISNENITLKIEKRAFKEVTIEPRITGKVKDGYMLGTITIEPPTVTISGSANRLKEVGRIRTRQISVEKQFRSFSKEVKLDLNDLTNVNVDYPEVLVRIPVMEAEKLKKIITKINMINSDDAYNYSLKNEEVTVYVNTEDPNETIDEKDVRAVIDVNKKFYEEKFKTSEINNLEKKIKIKIVLVKKGTSASIAMVEPDSVIVKIGKK